MKPSNFQLLPFQLEAVNTTVDAIYKYEQHDRNKNLFTAGNQIQPALEGKPKPYIHRIKAITGSGKTPILAAISARLPDCIILWTTPRAAIIDQTAEKLKNKYNNLLRDDTEIYELEDVLKNCKSGWNQIIEMSEGCTIITTTVAAFNQKNGDILTVHRGNPSPWQQLSKEAKRPIWVFYDEGHNATENQLQKLLELNPRGFILASASPLPADLQMLLPGENKEAKENILNNFQTTIIDTKKVVLSGLLKSTIKIRKIETIGNEILKAAYDERDALEELSHNNVIACYMVDNGSNGTGLMQGFDIWEQLITFGADPKSIAVHLSGAKKGADNKCKASNGLSEYKNLIATYDEGLKPGELKEQGFKHIIWNLSLEEGWDEPWAYIGYFHGEQANERKVIQRIGRLIRNPFKNDEGLPEIPTDEALRTVYCYLNASDEALESIVSHLNNDMNTSSLEAHVIKAPMQYANTRFIQVKSKNEITKLNLKPNTRKLQKELMKVIFEIDISDQEHMAGGKDVTYTIPIGEKVDREPTTTNLEKGALTTIRDIVKDYLSWKYSILVRKNKSTGPWIDPRIWYDAKFQKNVVYSSKAYYEYQKRCDKFINMLDASLSIELGSIEDDIFIFDSFKLINPNGGDNEESRTYYKVHEFKNSIHAEYNGLNNLELEIAKALDQFEIAWVRNTARNGYGIPIIQANNPPIMFYPDFIAWKNGHIFFIEAKGSHLIKDAIDNKLRLLPNDYLHLGIITKTKAPVEYQLYYKGACRTYDPKKPTLKELISEFIDI